MNSMALTSRISGRGQITIPKKVQETLGAYPDDLIAYEVGGKLVILKRVGPFDAVYHAALSQALGEWATAEDEEAFRDL
jgi:bifunctional DNA-binding transcriptional regulator/antitoxin component of YhaV-PrlF toxin-antitoxin module